MTLGCLTTRTSHIYNVTGVLFTRSRCSHYSYASTVKQR